MTSDDSMWDDIFHGCAWAAYIDQAQQERGRPDCEATRRRAFAYYEEALAEKNAVYSSGSIPITAGVDKKTTQNRGAVRPCPKK
jgi:hypothetical protein